jgi:hypothetical protein
MPYKIAGVAGTWYEPGTRKGNASIVWRGQLPDGTWTELVTTAGTQSAAQAHIRLFFENWHRDRPPAAGATVDLGTDAHHYKAQCGSDEERDRVDCVVGYLGTKTPIAAINQSHATVAAQAYRDERARANTAAGRRYDQPRHHHAVALGRKLRACTIVALQAGDQGRQATAGRGAARAALERPGQRRRSAAGRDRGGAAGAPIKGDPRGRVTALSGRAGGRIACE